MENFKVILKKIWNHPFCLRNFPWINWKFIPIRKWNFQKNMEPSIFFKELSFSELETHPLLENGTHLDAIAIRNKNLIEIAYFRRNFFLKMKRLTLAIRAEFASRSQTEHFSVLLYINFQKSEGSADPLDFTKLQCNKTEKCSV